MLDRLLKLIVDRKIFCWNRKNLEIKVLATLIYQAGISYRKVRDIFGCIESFSHEALRKWYLKLKALFVQEKKHHRAIPVDETKIKLENQWVYIWNAIDVDDHSILVVHVSTTRTSLDAMYFLRKVLEYCENKPLILVDRGPWYKWALQRLGLRYDHQTFGERNAIEQWYSLFKARVKRFWKRFPYHSSLESIKTWTIAWYVIYNLCWR